MINNKQKIHTKVHSFKRKKYRYIKTKICHVFFIIIKYALLISLGFVIATPLLKTFKTAITDQSMLGMKNSIWVPAAVSDTSFKEAWFILDYPKALLFSIINTAILMILQTFCASLAAYSFARLKFKGCNILFALVILTIIVPSQSLMIAQYIEFRNFDILGLLKLFTGKPINLIGSNFALYILAITGMGTKGGLFIYILRQNFRNLPLSIEEAAFVDGAGFLRTFFLIVMPSSKAALTTVGVLSFVWNYADVYTMSLLCPTDLHLPLKLAREQLNMGWAINGIQKYMPAEYVVDNTSPLVHIAVTNACGLLVILPLLVIYLFVQKHFVQGVERSGLGGD